MISGGRTQPVVGLMFTTSYYKWFADIQTLLAQDQEEEEGGEVKMEDSRQLSKNSRQILQEYEILNLALTDHNY